MSGNAKAGYSSNWGKKKKEKKKINISQVFHGEGI